MIERQGHIDSVAVSGACGAGEATHIELGPHMGDAGSLGQACGAAGIDEQTGVAGGHALADAAIGGQLAAAFQRLDQVALFIARLAEHPLLDMGFQPILDLFEGRGGLRIDDAVAGAGNVQAVGERRAGQLIVDQGGDDADLGQAIPDAEIFQPVGHEQRHRLAPPQVQSLGPMGVAIGDPVEFGIGDRAPFEGHGRPVAPLIDRRLQIVANQVGRVGRDRLHPFERTPQLAQKPQLTS